jgi:large subunit ribosomal protein L31
MKKDIHATDYRPVVIKDSNSDYAFLTRSTAKTDETIKWEDGQTYPLLTVHISSASHPYYTGEEKVLDVEGRVDRFKARQKAAQDRKAARSNKAKKAATKSAQKPESTKVGETAGASKAKAAKPKQGKPAQTAK